MPGATLPTRLLAIGDPKHPALAQKAARNLRQQSPPIIGRISENNLLLDPRTVPLSDDQLVIDSLKTALKI